MKKSQKKQVYCISLGCVRNLVDTEVMLGYLTLDGWIMTQNMKKADLILVNTCGFLESSRQEVFSVLKEVQEGKSQDSKIVACGCMVQKFSHELKAHFPDIHFYLGSGDPDQIIQAVSSKKEGESISSKKSFIEKADTPRLLTTPGHLAYLKIGEGCSKRCSYCLIPSIKGALKSKSEEQILLEFDDLLSQGVFEIILVAQDLGDYGKDHNEKNALVSLIRKMVKRKNNFWLRLLYHYPDNLGEELIELMASDSRICPYLDLPIQHMDDEILKAMRRNVTHLEILEIIHKLREKIANFHLRTTLIVGFPGEEERHFQALIDFVKQERIDHLGVFSFSKEEGTLAAKMAAQVPENIKEERRLSLLLLQQELCKERQKQKIGKKIPVLIEGFHPESKLLLVGRHQGQAPEVDGQVIINNAEKVDQFGKLFSVKISQVAGYDLVGQVISK